MEPIPHSGLYYANKFARIALDSFEEVMGRNGLHAILNLAQLPHLINNLPPDNLEREFDFAELSALNQALEVLYGARGARSFALRAGRATFDDALRNFGALAGVGDLSFKVLPLQTKLRIGLAAMARIFTQLSDQHSTVEERPDAFIYTIHRCPVCYGRRGMEHPVCYIATGLLQEGLKWVSGGGEFKITETRCQAMGDEVCEFTIARTPYAVPPQVPAIQEQSKHE